MHLWFSVFLLQYTDGCIWSIINDCTTALTILFCWKITVIEEHMLCDFFQNRGINITYAYETPSSIMRRIPIAPIFLYQYLIQVQWSLQMINIRIFQQCHVCVLHSSRCTLSIQFQFVNFPPILGAALIIAPWRHHLSCDNPSAWRYGEPCR